MTSRAEAFLAGLAALCRQHQIALAIGGEEDDARLWLGDLLPGAVPFSAYAFFEDQTTAALPSEERIP